MSAGDRSALPVFYDRYAPRAWAAALRVAGNRQAAAAAVEEAFWDAWQLAHTFDPLEQHAEVWIEELAARRAAERAGREARAAASSPPAIDTPGTDRVRDGGAGEDRPPEQVESALLARLRATDPRRVPVASRRTWIRWSAATAGITVAVALLTAGFVAARYEARIGELSREIARARARLQEEQGALRAEVARSTLAIELLRDPDTRVVELAPRGRATRASGRVIWNDERGGLLVTDELPPPPRDERYEVWLVAGTTTRHAGTLTIDAAGRGSLQIPGAPGAATVEAFTVTIESRRPPGPSGPVVLASP